MLNEQWMCSRSLRGAVLPPGGYVLALPNPLHPCKALVTLWVMLHSQRCLDPNALLQNYNSPSWGPVKAKGPGLAGCLLQLPPGLQCAACFRVLAPVVCPEADPAPRSLKSVNPGKWWQFWGSVEALAQFQGCLSLYRPCKGPPCLSSCKASIPGLTRASTHLSIKICETLSPEENIYSLQLPLVHYFPTPSFLASRRCLTSRMTTLFLQLLGTKPKYLLLSWNHGFLLSSSSVLFVRPQCPTLMYLSPLCVLHRWFNNLCHLTIELY